jgi:hypothetical protein
MNRATQGFYRRVTGLMAASVMLLLTASSWAGVIFHVGAGAVQPDENLLFNEPGLISTGTTIEGATNQSNAIVQIVSNDAPLETLTTPAAGQARVESMDGAFSSVMFVPQNNYFFSELEFNVNVLNQQSGTFQLTVVDQFNNVFMDDFNPDTLGSGENFFSVETDGGTLLKNATLTATANDQIVQDIRQIRLSIVVPEPGSSLLLGTTLPLGLLGLVRLTQSQRRRRF